MNIMISSKPLVAIVLFLFFINKNRLNIFLTRIILYNVRTNNKFINFLYVP